MVDFPGLAGVHLRIVVKRTVGLILLTQSVKNMGDNMGVASLDPADAAM